jgi:hypothetical protein
VANFSPGCEASAWFGFGAPQNIANLRPDAFAAAPASVAPQNESLPPDWLTARPWESLLKVHS